MEIKDLPEDIILTIFSNMESRQIVNTCLSHPKILDICERNQTFISKNILKKDYGFTQFPQNYNYANIMVYMMNKFRIVQDNSPEKRLMYTIKDNDGFREFNNFKEMLMYAVEPIAILDYIIVFREFNSYNEMLTYAVQDNRIDILRFLIENGANIMDGVISAIRYNKIDILRFLIENSGNSINTTNSVISAIKYSRFEILRFFIEELHFDIKRAIELAIMDKNVDVLKYIIEELHFDIINADELFILDIWFSAFVDPYLVHDTRIVDYLVAKYPQLLTHDLLESISEALRSLSPEYNVIVDYINLLLSSEDITKVESLSNFLNRPIRNLDQQYREIQSGFSDISEEDDTF
jgi:hypothetical protein